MKLYNNDSEAFKGPIGSMVNHFVFVALYIHLHHEITALIADGIRYPVFKRDKISSCSATNKRSREVKKVMLVCWMVD